MEVSNDLKYSSRMRFMLKDLIDLRNSGWVNRREPEKAKKLSEIRKDGSEKPSVPAKTQDARQLVTEPDGWQAVGKKSSKTILQKEVAKPVTSQKSGGSFGALLKDTRKSEKSKKKSTKESRSKNEASVAEYSPSVPEAEDDEQTGEVIDLEQDPAGSAEGLPGSDGQVDKETLRRLMNVVDEFFTNDMYSEALLSFKEIVDPRGMSEVVKSLLVYVLEKKDEHRRKTSSLLLQLFHDKFLTGDIAVEGVTSFLDVFDDLCIDVPKAGDYAAVVIGSMMANDIIPLSIFREIPEENSFHGCYKGAEVIICCLKEMCSAINDDAISKSAYDASGLSNLLLQRVNFGPKDEPLDVLNELAKKHGIPFALAVQ